MAYAVRQVNKGKTYVYIARNIYQADLKQSRQDREYLGTFEDGGWLTLGKNVSPPPPETVKLLEAAGIRYSPSRRRQRLRCHCGTRLVEGSCPLCSGAVSGVERIGAVHLFRELSCACGLDRCLKEAFGADSERLFLLALHRAATGRALYLADTYVAFPGRDGAFPSSQISRFLRGVGADKSSRDKFLLLWRNERDLSAELICDISSISAYSDRLRLVEWGYNRDHERLPQINLVLISERGAEGMPVAYRVLPGSIPDVSTLANTSEFITDLGYGDSAFRLDKGFYSKANVLRMHREGRRFVIGVPLVSNNVMQLFSKSLNSLKSGRRSFLWKSRVMRHVERTMAYNDKHGAASFTAHLYYEPERAADMRADFERRMLSIEQDSSDALLESRHDARGWLSERAGKQAGLFRIVANGMCHKAERKPNTVAAAMRFMGCTMILTNERELNAETALEAYRSRDSIEKLFDSMKNDNGQHRLRTGDDVIAEGQIFLGMVALMMRKALESRMREAGLLKKHSLDSVIAEIEKISKIKLTRGQHIMLEITKKQRELLNKMGISLPQT